MFDNARPRRIEGAALDSLLHDHGVKRVDLVRLDTESTESGVFAGMRQTIARDRPSIVCEVLPGRDTEPDLRPSSLPTDYRSTT